MKAMQGGRALLCRAEQQPAALRVLAAARHRGIGVAAVEDSLRYDVRSANAAGLLGDLIVHEAEILVVLERCAAIMYRAALRRCWATRAAGPAAAAERAADELARRLDDVGTTRAAMIRAELEMAR